MPLLGGIERGLKKDGCVEGEEGEEDEEGEEEERCVCPATDPDWE